MASASLAVILAAQRIEAQVPEHPDGTGRPSHGWSGSRIGTVGFVLFASREYVGEHGMLDDLANIDRHIFLQYDRHQIQGWSTSLMQEARALDRIKLRELDLHISFGGARGHGDRAPADLL